MMKDDMQITVRQGTIKDLPFLRQMLFEAFFWSPDYLRPPLSEFVNEPEIKNLLGNWGRNGDTAVIAQAGEVSVGAAWYRFWSADHHSYGYIDEETPELGMAVSAGFRSKGIGRKLLIAILEMACDQGIRSMSLSVDPHNFALHLYESEGFSKVGESGTSWTMKKELTKKR
jgi:ribosomal protein S18 acetylase RimI-like enzyme